MKKIVKGILEPVFNIADTIYLNKYYNEVSKENIINFDEKLDKIKKSLIISPHQDDESIGMGGTIVKLVNSGCNVDVLYLTDGRQGDNEEISLIRKTEASKALKIYGLETNTTLNFENKTLDKNIDKVAKKIDSILELLEYDAVFLTSNYECNNDHAATYEIVGKLIDEKKFKEDVELYLYDINNSVQGLSLNCISPLRDEEAEKKWEAYRVFKSQVYITFSTLKIIDRKKLNIYDNADRKKYIAAEIFTNINIDEFIKKRSYDNSFRKNMKTATSSIRLIKNMKENRKYRKLMK